MRENGQISRMWEKWGTEFSTECFSNSDNADPLKFEDVTMAFAILSVTMALVFILVLAEMFVGSGKKTVDPENFMDNNFGSCPLCHRHWQLD